MMKSTLIVGLIAIAALLVSRAAAGIEEPDYTVIKSTDDYELRQYAPFLIARTSSTGSMRRAGSTAFRSLAGYIFGDNADQQKMAMTAPVISSPATASTEDQVWDYQFVMEKEFTMESLPKPNENNVELTEVPKRAMAAIRFSGRWSDRRVRDNQAALLDALERDGIRTLGDPVLARYNGPMTPWFLRRNEILVVIDSDDIR